MITLIMPFNPTVTIESVESDCAKRTKIWDNSIQKLALFLKNDLKFSATEIRVHCYYNKQPRFGTIG